MLRKYYCLSGDSIEKRVLLKIVNNPRYWKKFNSFLPKYKTIWKVIKYENLFPKEACDYLFNHIFFYNLPKKYSRTLLSIFDNKISTISYVFEKLKIYLDSQKQIEIEESE